MPLPTKGARCLRESKDGSKCRNWEGLDGLLDEWSQAPEQFTLARAARKEKERVGGKGERS